MTKISYWTDDSQTETGIAEMPAEVYTTICAMRADLLVPVAAQYLDNIIKNPDRPGGVDVATVELVEECARLYENASTLPGGPRWNYCTAAAVALAAIRECVVEINSMHGPEHAAICGDRVAEKWRSRMDRLESRQIREWVEFCGANALDIYRKAQIFCEVRSQFIP